jgi:HAD superfamily hydrolase (TIGR01509 family)
MSGHLRGVIFDMDGVLVESEPWIADAAIRMFAELGHALTAKDFHPFIGMGEDRFLSGPAEAKGVTDFDLAAAKRRTYAIYLDIIRGRLGPATGAHAFISRCVERGLLLAVATSADDVKVRGNLDELGLPDATFRAIVTGDQVSRKKPAPDIFIEAARRLGLDPAACLVVEDAVAGVDAARAAGCRCLALSNTFPAEALARADWVAPDLAHAPEAALDW